MEPSVENPISPFSIMKNHRTLQNKTSKARKYSENQHHKTQSKRRKMTMQIQSPIGYQLQQIKFKARLQCFEVNSHPIEDQLNLYPNSKDKYAMMNDDQEDDLNRIIPIDLNQQDLNDQSPFDISHNNNNNPFMEEQICAFENPQNEDRFQE